MAWFSIAAMLERPITIYGDGLQIRDLLHVNDLVAAYKAAAEKPDRSAGQIFNMGGGPTRTLSLGRTACVPRKAVGKENSHWSRGAACRRSAGLRGGHS